MSEAVRRRPVAGAISRARRLFKRAIYRIPFTSRSSLARVDIDMGELMFLLKNARRRRVIQKVVAYDDGSGVELGTLAVEIAAAEQEIDPDDVTCKQRKRVYIGLYQCHLPKLDANGIIEFDGDQSGKVYSTDTTWAFNRTLESMLKLAGGENQ